MFQTPSTSRFFFSTSLAVCLHQLWRGGGCATQSRVIHSHLESSVFPPPNTALCTVCECITIYRTYFTVPVILASLGTRRIKAFIKTAFFHPLHLKLDGVTDAKETGCIQRCVCYVLHGSRGLCSKLIIDFAGIHFVPIYTYTEQLSCLNNDFVFPQNYIMRRWNSPLKATLMKCLWGQKLLGTVQHFGKKGAY